MNLTAPNGSTITVDPLKIEAVGPHIDGGAVVQVGVNVFQVTEKPNKILYEMSQAQKK